MEPIRVETDASRKNQAGVWFEGSEHESVEVEAGGAENEVEDEEPYVFPQCALAPAPGAAPKGRMRELLTMWLACYSM